MTDNMAIYVLGVGMTPFGRFPERPLEQLGREAVLRALADAQVSKDVIEEVFCGSSFGGMLMGQRILKEVGITGGPVTNVENACSGGATALREALTAIRAGRCETALIVGGDSLSGFGGGTLPLEEADLEVNHGMVMPAVYAMRARRYLEETGATEEDLALVSVKARGNGANNEYAQLRSPVSAEEVLQSRMIADPLRLFMSCPTGDGAAALVVTASRTLAEERGGVVKVTASVLQSGEYHSAPHDIVSGGLTARTARLAYDQAGIGPEDLGLVELHDAFAIAELMYYDALGISERGGSIELLRSGHTSVAGAQPVNASGGLLSRGHPIGATGAAQVCEVVWQLRGEAGAKQVANQPSVALTHCTGGGISGLDHGACAVHIFQT